MRVIVTVEHRFRRTPDGAIWTEAAFSRRFWERYLEVFDDVQVVARVAEVESVPAGWVRADGHAVSFACIPYYVGPLQYLGKLLRVRAALNSLATDQAAVIMRVPSFISAHLTRALRAVNHPFGVEVVGDPFDVFAAGAIRHPLRPLLRWLMPRQLRKQCESACAVAYVTEWTLQRRYPCRAYSTGVSDVHLPSEAIVVEGDVLSTHFSSIELDDSAWLRTRKPRKAGSTYRLITVASLEQPYKGVQHLIAAVDTCLRQGLDLELHVVGDGRYRAALEQRAGALGIKERVTFAGQLPAGQAVRERLDDADVFVLASLTEGLPRAMIEAMARGLPCIGTNVGGIPELLPEESMVLPGDAPALAAKIIEVLSDQKRMASMSSVNLERARNFSEPVLRGRRAAFYRHLQGVTEDWIAARSRECVPTPA